MNNNEKPADGTSKPVRPYVKWVVSADGVLTDEMVEMLDREDLGSFEKFMRENQQPFSVEDYRRPGARS